MNPRLAEITPLRPPAGSLRAASGVAQPRTLLGSIIVVGTSTPSWSVWQRAKGQPTAAARCLPCICSMDAHCLLTVLMVSCKSRTLLCLLKAQILGSGSAFSISIVVHREYAQKTDLLVVVY